MTRALLCALLAACINQSILGGSSSQPTPGGTATCRTIVTDCDSQCTTPFCLRDCTARGTPEAQQQHNALLDCAQRNACTDEPCIRTNCPSESAACEGPTP